MQSKIAGNPLMSRQSFQFFGKSSLVRHTLCGIQMKIGYVESEMPKCAIVRWAFGFNSHNHIKNLS